MEKKWEQLPREREFGEAGQVLALCVICIIFGHQDTTGDSQKTSGKSLVSGARVSGAIQVRTRLGAQLAVKEERTQHWKATWDHRLFKGWKMQLFPLSQPAILHLKNENHDSHYMTKIFQLCQSWLFYFLPLITN